MNEDLDFQKNLRFLLLEQSERFRSMDLGHPRDLIPSLKKQLASPLILVITGLRRCGKSTLQAQLAQFFPQDYYYLNFDDERWLGFEAKAFSQVHETLIELFGEKKYFLMDEVQNIPGWELFVRRLHDSGYQLIITGSNASLLSREIGSRLTGRYRLAELFPFSFSEYLAFRGVEPKARDTKTSAKLKKTLRAYLQYGGIPDALKYPEENFCGQLYQDILYRDISARYSVDNFKNLREMSLFLASNVGGAISYNKLRQMLMLGSVNTVKAYMEYLEASWLYFTINVHSHSVKQQQIAPKKVYSIDNGILKQIAFHSSENLGWYLENAVFLHLRRHHSEIFYAKNDDGSEVDFLLRKGSRPSHLIQASASLKNATTRERELTSLKKAMKEYSLREGWIITFDEKEEIREAKQTIHVLPATEWLQRAPE